MANHRWVVRAVSVYGQRDAQYGLNNVFKFLPMSEALLDMGSSTELIDENEVEYQAAEIQPLHMQHKLWFPFAQYSGIGKIQLTAIPRRQESMARSSSISMIPTRFICARLVSSSSSDRRIASSKKCSQPVPLHFANVCTVSPGIAKPGRGRSPRPRCAYETKRDDPIVRYRLLIPETCRIKYP